MRSSQVRGKQIEQRLSVWVPSRPGAETAIPETDIRVASKVAVLKPTTVFRRTLRAGPCNHVKNRLFDAISIGRRDSR